MGITDRNPKVVRASRTMFRRRLEKMQNELAELRKIAVEADLTETHTRLRGAIHDAIIDTKV